MAGFAGGVAGGSASGAEGNVDRPLLESAHLEHRKANNIPFRIDLFHHLIVSGFSELAFLALEDHL
jgi:hypothetical protein